MSAEHQIALALRKERLMVRVGQQRDKLAELGERLRKPCALADKAMDAGRYVKGHPLAAGAGFALLAVLGRRHVFRVAGYVWSAWKAWRFASRFAQESGLIKRFINN